MREAFLIECLAWGLLRAYGVEGPPVPVREMIRNPLSIFEHLNLLELNLGLYDAAYRTCLNGVRLIAVDLTKPRPVQRASMARELYVAFCRSARADELHWPHRDQPHAFNDFFARCLLAPAVWVHQVYAAAASAEEAASLFDVPVEMIDLRLSEIDRVEKPPASIGTGLGFDGESFMNAERVRKPIDILIVEDNPGDVRLVEEAFKCTGVSGNISVAVDGVEAMSLLHRGDRHADVSLPDLILLDLNMPRKDGYQVLAEVKTDENLRRIPVIVLTTSKKEEDVLKAYSLHANCYITKPSDLGQFIQAVRCIEKFWASIAELPLR